MSENRVVIVGKPNVGKSTLFNRLVGKRKSIVHNMPGVTRDIIEDRLFMDDISFTLIDTGGLVPEEKDWLVKKIREKVIKELERAKVIIFLTDGREGLTSLDEYISDILQRYRDKVILAVNKIDNPTRYENISEFYSLGFEEIIPISAIHGEGIFELIESIKRRLGNGKTAQEEEYIKVSFVGRPNTGKSSLINKILKEERVIVSPEAGTTRDAIDIPFEWEGKKFILIDTAGIRRPSRVEYGIEFFSVGRSLKTVERSDVVCLVIDCTEGITKQDKRLAGLIERKKRGLVLILNKIDICRIRKSEGETYIGRELSFVDYAPLVLTSAIKGEGIEDVLKAILRVYEDFNKRIKTSMVNNIVRKIFKEKKPPLYKNKEVKVFYSFQKDIKPPTFVLITNFKEGWKKNYIKFFLRRFREYSGIIHSPIEIIIEERKD